MMTRNFEGFASNSGAIIANSTTMPYKGNAKGRRWSMDLTDVERIRMAVPELKAVVPIFQSWGNATCRNGRYSYAGSALGAVPAFAEINEPKIYSGRFINEADEAQARIENIQEFMGVVQEFSETHADDDAEFAAPTEGAAGEDGEDGEGVEPARVLRGDSLADFIEWVRQRTDLDTVSEDGRAVTQMTVHSAKGLEFDCVFEHAIC